MAISKKIIAKNLATISLFEIPLVVSSVQQFADWLISQLTRKGTALAIMVVSMQDIMARRFQPKTRTAFQSFDYFTMDGMPLVWLARWLGQPAQRIYGPDLFEALLNRSNGKSIKHYFYGSDAKTLQALRQAVQTRWPHLTIAGWYAPPFRSLTATELAAVVAQINRSKPDIVWIGLGSWKQLEWVHQAKNQLKTRLIIPVGMAFDLLAGTKPQASRWLQRSGLEWLFRLFAEPNRLWQRYIFQVPVFGCWWLWEFLTQSWHRWRSN